MKPLQEQIESDDGPLIIGITRKKINRETETDEMFLNRICSVTPLCPKEISSVSEIGPSPMFWDDGEDFRFFIYFKNDSSESSACYPTEELCQKDRMKLIELIKEMENAND